MLFIVNDKDFFEVNPGAKAIPQFRAVSSDEMKAICLLFDYKTPFKQLSYNQRLERAIDAIGLKKTPKGRPSKIENNIREMRTDEILAAKKQYEKMQFDEDRDTIDAYDQFIFNVKEAMRSAKDPMDLKRVAELSEKLVTIVKHKKELMEILQLRDENEASQITSEEFDTEAALVENLLDADEEV